MAQPESTVTITSEDLPFYAREMLTNLSMPNLRNQIHPLFSPAKMPGIPYNESIFAFRLASHFLKHLSPLLHTILCTRPMQQRLSEGEAQYYFSEPATSLTQNALVELNEKLTEVASCTKFELTTKSDPDDGSDGFTSVHKNSSLPTLPGYCSTISVDDAFFEQIGVALNSKDIVNYTWLSFHLAVFLVHEFMHVCTFASMRIPRGNAFVGNSKCTEIGCEMERRLLGGQVQPHPVCRCKKSSCSHSHELYSTEAGPSALQQQLVVIDWPNQQSVDYYTKNKEVAIRPDAVFAPFLIIRRIPFLNIHRLFQDEFWVGIESRQRQGLNYLPLQLGNHLGVYVPFEKHEPTWTTDLSRRLRTAGTDVNERENSQVPACYQGKLLPVQPDKFCTVESTAEGRALAAKFADFVRKLGREHKS